MTDICHRLCRGLYRSIQCERQQILTAHVIADRRCLTDHLACHIGTVRRADDHAPPLFCQHTDCATHFCSCAYNDAACIHLHRSQLTLAPVTDNDNIPGGDRPFQRFRAAGTDDDVTAYFFVLCCAHKHGAIQCLHHILIARLRLCQYISV